MSAQLPSVVELMVSYGGRRWSKIHMMEEVGQRKICLTDSPETAERLWHENFVTALFKAHFIPRCQPHAPE